MRRWFKTDLHVHTCLSPCADLTMSPRKIVAEVLRQQLDIIAITDHNSAENVSAVRMAAAGSAVVVLAGMEVCTVEEAHVLAVFDNPESALALQALVFDHLQGENNPDVFGLQVIANEADEVEGFQEKLLIGATDISLEETVQTVHRLQGLAIAAHIDRESFSVIGQLGFIPETVRFDALEISTNISNEEAGTRFREYAAYRFVRNSDAHFLDQLGKNATGFLLEQPTLQEIADVLHASDGRNMQLFRAHA